MKKFFKLIGNITIVLLVLLMTVGATLAALLSNTGMPDTVSDWFPIIVVFGSFALLIIVITIKMLKAGDADNWMSL